MSNYTTTGNNSTVDTATFGAGCFWCVEAIFLQLKGVVSVTSGYMGGTLKNPGYREVCTGTTGHAEVVQIVYNPQQISYRQLLSVFFKTHDPTTMNRQGADVGTQYRSVLFYHSDAQKEIAEKTIAKLNAQSVFNAPVVTEVTKAVEFYKAEEYHQNYYSNNPEQGYCRMVILPKLEKFKKVFSDSLELK